MVQRRGESRVLNEARSFRAAVLNADARLLGTLRERYRPVYAVLTQRVDALSALIARRARAGEITSPGAIVRLAEYQQMAEELRNALAEYSQFAGQAITAQQRAHITRAVNHAQRLAAAQLPDGVTMAQLAALGHAWGTVDPQALEVMVGMMRNGSTLSSYLRGQLVQGTVQHLTDTLTAGMLENPRVTARALKVQLAGGAVQALRVARTETLRAYREAERAQYQENPGLVKGYRRMASLDDRTCIACWLLDGTLYPSDRELDEHVCGRCFTVPELVTMAELGVTGVDEPPPLVRAEDTGRARFLAMDEAEQRARVRNDKLYDLYASRQIPLHGLIGWTQAPVWGTTMQANSAVRAAQGFYAPRLPAHDTPWRPG